MSHPLPTDCKSVSAECPVEASIYGYYPSLGANYFFLGVFGLLAFVNFYLGVRYRTWTYMIAMTFGCLGEAIGYSGRVLLHNNPFSSAGFETQITTLIISPAFFSAAIYLVLKHLVLCFGPEYSRVSPRYYTWIFISCDIFTLVIQGAGGGVAATSKTNLSQQKIGNDLLMTGIVIQVVTLLVFATAVSDYFFRLYRSTAHLKMLSMDAQATASDLKFQVFIAGLLLAFSAIFTRCVYRIAEMAGGWRNTIQQDQTDFIVLDGVMVLTAAWTLTILHPGYCFPKLAGRSNSKSMYPNGDKSSNDILLQEA